MTIRRANFTIRILRNKVPSQDNTVTIQYLTENSFIVTFRDPDVRLSHLMTYTAVGLHTYIRSLLTLLRRDTDPFESIQFIFPGFPSVLYTMERLKSESLCDSLMDLVHLTVHSWPVYPEAAENDKECECEEEEEECDCEDEEEGCENGDCDCDCDEEEEEEEENTPTLLSMKHTEKLPIELPPPSLLQQEQEQTQWGQYQQEEQKQEQKQDTIFPPRSLFSPFQQPNAWNSFSPMWRIPPSSTPQNYPAPTPQLYSSGVPSYSPSTRANCNPPSGFFTDPHYPL